MAENGVTFKSILDPVTAEEFFCKYWERESLLNTTQRHGDLLSLNDVDFLISSLSTAEDGIIVQPNTPVPSRLKDILSLSRAYSAYTSGYTIVLTRLERRWPPITELCRDIVQAFVRHQRPLQREVGANMYLTPHRSQAFPPHYDNHDVFIIQIQGSKHWRLYESLESFPSARQVRQIKRDALPPLVKELTLNPGQVLYIPRGAYHEALTSDSFSLHLTIGVFPDTWADLASRLIEKQATFREALPAFSAQQLKDDLTRRINELGTTLQIDAGTVELE